VRCKIEDGDQSSNERNEDTQLLPSFREHLAKLHDFTLKNSSQKRNFGGADPIANSKAVLRLSFDLGITQF
jgi:hypothetical protein